LRRCLRQRGSKRRFNQHTPAFQVGQDATDGGHRKRKALFKKDVTQFVLAPAWKLASQREHLLDLLGRPAPTTKTARAMRTPLQRG
jgi:hypothetical protein